MPKNLPTTENDDDEKILPEEIEDAGLNDDEGGGEADREEAPDEEAEEGVLEEEPQSRGARRIQKLSETARQEAARRQELEIEVANLKREREQREAQSRQPRELTAEEEQAKLALMTVEERVDYKLAKAERLNQFHMNVTRFQAADMADKAAYESRAASDPRYKRYAKEVEDLLAQERRSGRDFPRETILTFIIGRKVMNGGAVRAKAQKDGQERIQRQQARADSGRGDRAASRRDAGGDSLAALEKRLEGVLL